MPMVVAVAVVEAEYPPMVHGAYPQVDVDKVICGNLTILIPHLLLDKGSLAFAFQRVNLNL
jgi:hypothetical protein